MLDVATSAFSFAFASLVSYVHFIGFDGFTFAAKLPGISGRAESRTNAVCHKPRALECDPHGPVKLVRADAFLGRANQMDRGQPVPHSDMAGLENRPDLDRKRLPAGVALVETGAVAFAFECARAVYDATVRAYATIGPKSRLDIGIGGGFVVEMGGSKDGFGHG